jgi:hypothetical protein
MLENKESPDVGDRGCRQYVPRSRQDIGRWRGLWKVKETASEGIIRQR